MQAQTIDEVIEMLESIIARCRADNSRLGYFASLYRRMTIGVKDGIRNGLFEDGPRMERLDVVFANRYLDAYHRYTTGQAPTASWRSAFDAVKNEKLTVVQHLLLGMNAHINLDLGIAAAEVTNTSSIGAMLPDYNKINDIIAGMLGLVQDCLTKIAFPMYFIRRIDQRTTHAVLNFSIAKARETAWNNALILSEAGPAGIPQVISTTDNIVHTVACNIQSPGRWMGLLLGWVRWTENKSVAANIGFLNE